MEKNFSRLWSVRRRLHSKGSILNNDHSPRENFDELYILGPKLGSGHFGITYQCKLKSTGEIFACKVVDTKRLLHWKEVEDVQKEVEILHHVAGQKNIVDIRGAYEDEGHIYIVTDLYRGGELFVAIVERAKRFGKPYSEREAARLAKNIIEIVERCHALGVVHRDLKPENFLFNHSGSDAELYVIDFGLAEFYKPGIGMKRACGSLLYMAPEVTRCINNNNNNVGPKAYGREVDIWSVGVIIYALLCGYAPFGQTAKTKQEVLREVVRGNLKFVGDPWPSISEDAKDLLKWMLQTDPAKRPTAHQALCHKWISEPGSAPAEPLPPVVAQRLKHFSTLVMLKKVAMQIIAANLREEEIAGLKAQFSVMDADNSGTITLEELREGLRKMGSAMTDEEIEKVFKETDLDGSHTIEYSEFIAGTLHLNKLGKQDNLRLAFQKMDEDGSGFLTLRGLRQTCKDFNVTDDEIRSLIRSVDKNEDGMIDYSEFLAMMWEGNGGLGVRAVLSNVLPSSSRLNGLLPVDMSASPRIPPPLAAGVQ